MKRTAMLKVEHQGQPLAVQFARQVKITHSGNYATMEVDGRAVAPGGGAVVITAVTVEEEDE